MLLEALCRQQESLSRWHSFLTRKYLSGKEAQGQVCLVPLGASSVGHMTTPPAAWYTAVTGVGGQTGV